MVSAFYIKLELAINPPQMSKIDVDVNGTLTYTHAM